MAFEIYEVVEAGTTRGYYNCYKKMIVASEWASASGDKLANVDAEPVFVSVLNVLEFGTPAGSEKALATGDRLWTWDYTDCAGTVRKIGTPITPEARMFKTIQGINYADADGILCNMIANDGTTEITTGLGSNIKVFCLISMNEFAYELHECRPHLEADVDGGDFIFAVWSAGQWRSVAIFSPKKSCTNV